MARPWESVRAAVTCKSSRLTGAAEAGGGVRVKDNDTRAACEFQAGGRRADGERAGGRLSGRDKRPGAFSGDRVGDDLAARKEIFARGFADEARPFQLEIGALNLAPVNR